MVNEEFENLLDECLKKLLLGETVDQCVEQFPEQADELRPLLEIAHTLKTASTIQPSHEFRAKARFEFQNVLTEKYEDRSLLAWMPRWVTITGLLVGLMSLFISIIITSTNSMPESPLYAVKLLTEQVGLTLTLDPLQKVQYQSDLAERRITEIIYLADKGNAEFIGITNRRLEERLTALSLLIPILQSEEIIPPRQSLSVMTAEPAKEAAGVADMTDGEEADGDTETEETGLKATLQQDAIENETALRACIEKASINIKEVLLETLNISISGYEEAMEAFS